MAKKNYTITYRLQWSNERETLQTTLYSMKSVNEYLNMILGYSNLIWCDVTYGNRIIRHYGEYDF